MCINTFAGICNVIDVHNNTVNFHRKCVHFEGDKILFWKSYDKTNLTLVVILYEIYVTRWFGSVRASVSQSVCPSVCDAWALGQEPLQLGTWNLVCSLYMKIKRTRIFSFR